MIVIKKPTVKVKKDKAVLECKILANNKEKNLFYEIDKKYKDYLCTERSDAFVIAVLHYAMKHNFDIYSDLPMTESLYHNIVVNLMPTLAKNSDMLNEININVPIETSVLSTKGEVGTGMSCGIDSFHTLQNYLDPKEKGMKLTCLCLNNVGSLNTYNKIYNGAGEEKVQAKLIERASNIAKQVGLPLIITNSNVHKLFPDSYYRVHTFANMFSVFIMQKFFKTYYYSSSGLELEDFTVKDSFELDSGEYDLLTFYTLNTENLKIYSEGIEKSRLEKTIDIANFDLAQKNLHVCCVEDYNCGICKKCRRTILALDAIGKLDNFKNVFDIDYYKNNKKEYYDWLDEVISKGDKMNLPTYKLLKQKQGQTEYSNIELYNKYNIIIPDNNIGSILIKDEENVILSKNEKNKLNSNLTVKLNLVREMLKHEDKKCYISKRYFKKYHRTIKSICTYIKDIIFNKKKNYNISEAIYALLYSNKANVSFLRDLKKLKFIDSKNLRINKGCSLDEVIGTFNDCISIDKFKEKLSSRKVNIDKNEIKNNTNIKICAGNYYKNYEYGDFFYEVKNKKYYLVGKINNYTFAISSSYIGKNSIYEDVMKVHYLLKTLDKNKEKK